MPSDHGMTLHIEDLPLTFQTFLHDNDIDPTIYTQTDLPRYIRWNTNKIPAERPTLEQLQQELGTDQVWHVKGLEGFFGFLPLEATKRLVDITSYQNGSIFGIDLSSALAVDALEVAPNDHVLDLCCAPGAKLCMIANLQQGGQGTVTGVDIASHRLATCRALVRRYGVGERVRLFAADGTTFAISPPSRIGAKILEAKEDTHSHRPVIKPFWAPKLLRSDRQQSSRLYEKVLVDAECTHDGSISHILKYQTWGWDKLEANVIGSDRLESITHLQRALMVQGWAMCATGGRLVYSTCSLTIAQNEENVVWFLSHFPDAELETIPRLQDMDIQLAPIKQIHHAPKDTMHRIQTHCVRFDPLNSRTSGFFLASFKKKSNRGA